MSHDSLAICAACKRPDLVVVPYRLTVILTSLGEPLHDGLHEIKATLCWDCARNAVAQLAVTRLSENTPDTSP